MKKRFFALILSLLICLGCVPISAYAQQFPPTAAMDTEETMVPETAAIEPELHWYDHPEGWDDTEGEVGAGFNPYSFSVNEDRTVSARVSLPSAFITEDATVMYAASGSSTDPDAPVVDLVNATYVTDGANVSVSVGVLLDSATDVTHFMLYELTDNETESIYTVPDSTGTVHHVKAMTSVQFDNSTMVSGTENGRTVVELNTNLKLFGNAPTEIGVQTTIALTATKAVSGEYIESALSTMQVTVEGEEEAPIVPAPILQNATCVSDGSALTASLRFLVEDTTDIADVEVYELSDTEPIDSMGTVNGTYFVKSIMTVPFDNSTMNLGPDSSGMTVIEFSSTLYPGSNALTAVGEQTLIAVQVVKRINNRYVSSPISDAKQVTVEGEPESVELTSEELQAFIPTNLRMSVENATYTLDVTVTWDNPTNATMVEFYEVENGLLVSGENGTSVYPFDGVVQDTIIAGDGTVPYEYQTVNGTNILRYSVMKKISEDMKKIDEELGIALCVQEGDTIQTTLWACVGELSQMTEARSAAWLFSADGPLPLNTNSTSVQLTPEQSVYSGEQLRPAVSVSYEGSSLTPGTDYDLSFGENLNVGDGSVTVIGKGRYCENVTAVFPITPLSLNDESVDVSLLNSTCIYTGSPILAEVSVLFNGTSLREGTDYQTAYSDNTAAGIGTAKVTVTGLGNFGDAVTKTFSIITPDLTLPASLTAIESEAFAGGRFKSVVIPTSVTVISESAFADCNLLSHVFIYSNHVTIADDAFPTGTGIVIHCREGSDAALFAKRNGLATEYIP